MREAEDAAALRAQVDEWRRAGERVALVPTMGNLHSGHLSLVKVAAGHAERVICSIFVNPAQFGPDEDYERYPRTPEADRQQLRAAGVDVVFLPSVAEMYPYGPAGATQVRVPEIADVLCGAYRPGHFDGVATVVLRLFHMARPDVAVFGEKDFQQLAIIRRLVRDLSLPLDVVGAATWRDPDGLALSSRNQYLTAEERRRAPLLFAALERLRDGLRTGADDLRRLEREALETLREAGFRPEYVEVRRADTLAPAGPGEQPLVVLAAAWLGRARLIDNLRLS